MGFSGIVFEPPSEIHPRKMLQLADGLRTKEWRSVIQQNAFPPKSVSDILRLLAEKNYSEITILDWLHLFSEKDAWDVENSQQAVAVSSANIFKGIAVNPHVCHLALFRTVLALDGRSACFPKVLIEHIHFLEEYLTGYDRELLELILLLRDKNYLGFVRVGFNVGLTPLGLVKKFRLVESAQLVRKLHDCLPEYFNSRDILTHSEWLINLLNETNGPVCIFLLERVTELCSDTPEAIKNNPTIFNWFARHCDPRTDDSYWFNLSDVTRKFLTKILKISEYYKFSDLVRALQQQQIACDLGLDEHAVKQIRSRSIFWGHYKLSILSCRILLPAKTSRVLDVSAEKFETFKADATSEAIIMEFLGVIIVEVLRGEASEVRLFTKNTRTSNLLLKSDISLDDIRRAHQDSYHDHAFCWQWACEKWLRVNFSITPDDYVKEFRGLPFAFKHYDRSSGLVHPDTGDIQRRLSDLELWSRSFHQRERRLGKYGADKNATDDALAQRVYSLIVERPGLTAREYEKILHVNKADINRVLYRNLKGLCDHDRDYTWYTVKGTKPEFSQPVEQASEHISAAEEHLFMGKQYHDVGDFKTMIGHLNEAAKLNNTEAMVILGSHYLTQSRASMEKRIRGEFWLKKALELGDDRAKQLLGIK